MDRISRGFIVSWIVLSSIHMLIIAQDTTYPPPPSPDSGPINPPSHGSPLKKIYCDAKCSLKCFRRINRWRTPLCMGMCLAKCLLSPTDISYDCTTECAYPTIASFHSDAENLDGVEFLKQVQDSMSKCYRSCDEMIDQKP